MNLLEEDIIGQIGHERYTCRISWRKGVLIMDESQKAGGQEKGPDPYSTFLAALAGCTLATLRMYIDRKGWDIPEIEVRLNMRQDQEGEFTTQISRHIYFSKATPEEQKVRLFQIAEKCPVSKILTNRIQIKTQIL